jgi:hypothetical protein
VGDDHVPVGAGVVVEIRAPLDREGLGHVDLHVGDVLAVSHRLEQAVANRKAFRSPAFASCMPVSPEEASSTAAPRVA